MKALIGLVAAAAVLVGGFSAEAQQKSRLNKILDSGTIRVGTTGDFNPMSFRNPATNEYEGFDIDMVKELAKDMGVKVQFVATDWKSLVQGIVSDKYDVSTSASINPGRAKAAGYTITYFGTATVPLTLKKNLEKFKGGWTAVNSPDVTVAVTLGTVFEQEARDYLQKAKIKTVEAPARDFQEVLAGRADIGITSNLEASTLVKTYPDLAIVPVDKVRARKPQAMLVAQDDQVWINYLNHWITWKKDNGFFDGLEEKWMGPGWYGPK